MGPELLHLKQTTRHEEAPKAVTLGSGLLQNQHVAAARIGSLVDGLGIRWGFASLEEFPHVLPE
jgi:hypothetical protein